VEWAATTNFVDAAGAQQQAPVGPACSRCYAVSIDTLGYSTWAAFHAAATKKPEVWKTFETALANHSSRGAVKISTPSEVVVDSLVEAEVECSYVGYNETTLRKKLNTQRLTRAVLKEVPEIALPSLCNPNEFVTWYLFAKPPAGVVDEEGACIRLRSKTVLRQGEFLLRAGDNLFEQHGNTVYRTAAEGTCTCKKAAAKELPTLDDWLAARGKPDATPRVSLASAPMEVSGAAAMELEVVDADAATKAEEADARDLTDKLVGKSLAGSGGDFKRLKSGGLSSAGDEAADESEADEADADITAGLAAENLISFFKPHFNLQSGLAQRVQPEKGLGQPLDEARSGWRVPLASWGRVVAQA
jgi:hypothetical protein